MHEGLITLLKREIADRWQAIQEHEQKIVELRLRIQDIEAEVERLEAADAAASTPNPFYKDMTDPNVRPV